MKKTKTTSYRRRAPAMTAEEREDQLIYLATELAEKQLLEGTASPSVITHYLKLGSTKERLEREKLSEENKLLRAKTDAIRTQESDKEMYKKAMEAFGIYSGNPRNNDEFLEVDIED